MKVMTYNIRVDVSVDGTNAFTHRVPAIKTFLMQEKPDIIGFQEVKPHMLETLKDLLPAYDYVGEPRDHNDEYNPIFYLKKYEALYTKTNWYGNTPEVMGSKDEHAMLPRIYTVLHLKVNNQIIEVVNTHFSHISHVARVNSLNTLTNYFKSRTKNYPIILMGDFNAYPHQDIDNLLSPFLTSCWDDFKGESLTFHGFSNKRKGLPIDYIWVSKPLKIIKTTLHRNKPNNQFLSDHYPVSCILN